MLKRDAAGAHGYRAAPGEPEIANQAEFDGVKAAQPKTLATPEIMSTRKIAAPKGARRPPGSPRPGIFSSAVDQIGNPFAPQVNGTGSVNGMNSASPFPTFGQQPQQTLPQNSSNPPNFSINSSSSSFKFGNASQAGNNLFMNSNQSQPDQHQPSQVQDNDGKAFSFTFGAGPSSDKSTKTNNTFNFGSTTTNNPFAGLSQTSAPSSGGLFSSAPTTLSNSFPSSQGTGLPAFGNTTSNGAQSNVFGAFGNISQGNGFGGPANNAPQGNNLFQQQTTDTSQQSLEQIANPFQQPQQRRDLFQPQSTQRASGNPFDQTENNSQQRTLSENRTIGTSDSMQVSPPSSPSRANGGQRSIFEVMTNGDQAQQAPKPNIFGNLQQKGEGQLQSSMFSSNQEQNSAASQSNKPDFSGLGANNSQNSESDSNVASPVPQQGLPRFSDFLQNKSQANTAPQSGNNEQIINDKIDKGSMGPGHVASPFQSSLPDPIAREESAASSATDSELPKFQTPSFKSGPFSNPFQNSTSSTPPSSTAPKFEPPSFTSGPFSNPFSKAAASMPRPSSAPELGAPSSEFQTTPKIFGNLAGSANEPSSTPKTNKSPFDPGVSFNPSSAKPIAAPANPEKSSASFEGSAFQFKPVSEHVQPSTGSKPSLSSTVSTAKPAETAKPTSKLLFGFGEARSDASTNKFGMSSPASKPFDAFPVKGNGVDITESSLFIPSEQTSLTPLDPSEKTTSQAVMYGTESLTTEQQQFYGAQRALRSLNYGFLRAMSALDPLEDQSDMMRAYLSAADKIKKGVQSSGMKRKQHDGPPDIPKRSRIEEETEHTSTPQHKSSTSNLFQRIVSENTTPSKAVSALHEPKTPISGAESRSLFANLTADAPATEPPNEIAGRSLFDRINNAATEVKKPAFSFFPPTPTPGDDGTPGDQTWKNDSPIRFGVSQTQTGQPQFLFAGSTPGSATTSRATSPGAGDGGMTSEAESTTSNTADDAEKPLDQVDLTAVDDSSEILYETDKARGSTRDLETKSWVVRGQGPLRILKDRSSGLITVLLRTVPSGRVVFNSRLVKGLPYKVVGKNAATLPIIDAAGKPETWYVRFKSQDLADKFAESCEKWKESAS